VMMTDGVLDNLEIGEVVQTVAANAEKLSSQEIAESICRKAYSNSISSEGKPDDITTLVVKYYSSSTQKNKLTK